jgi:thiamine-phosphate pyrophosphorylase
VGLPKLYAIVDRGTLDAHGVGVREFAEELRAGGVRLVQYRDKVSGAQEILRACGVIASVFSGCDAALILNDRADLAALAGWGCHVGQGDLGVGDVRRLVGVVGVSTHTVEQVEAVEREFGPKGSSGVAGASRAAGPSTARFAESANRSAQDDKLCVDHQNQSAADYVAVGPVFGTLTKVDAEAVVGLEGVRAARAVTRKPLVAIGGITVANAQSVVEAGADSVAVISGLMVEGRRVREVVRDFVEVLR